jgi:hypothetical protein
VPPERVDLLERAREYRQKAVDLRRLAAITENDGIRGTYLTMAKSYDLLATDDEQAHRDSVAKQPKSN